jgi:predicted homoserine dehydrogenase-like protein
LKEPETIDCVSCLREPHGTAMGGGVFAVIDSRNEYSRTIMHAKGMLPNSFGNAGLICRLYHLCGVETAISLMTAVLLEMPSNVVANRTGYDVVAETTRNFKAGEVVGSDKSPDLRALVREALPETGQRPLPLHLARSNKFLSDTPKRTILTTDIIETPKDFTLWSLASNRVLSF